MNSKKPRKQLQLDNHYEELCFKYGIKYHPPAFNETKIERQKRLKSLRCQLYSACDNIKSINFEKTTCKTANMSRDFKMSSQSIVLSDTDSGIGKSYTMNDKMDIDFVCETDTLSPKITNVTNANDSVSIDSRVNIVSQLQTPTVSNCTANNISKCIKQTIPTNFDILSLDNIDMTYKTKCDEAGLPFEPPNLNEIKQDRKRRLHRMKMRINRALKSHNTDNEMDIDFVCVTDTRSQNNTHVSVTDADASVSIDSQVNVTSSICNFVANETNTSIRQPMPITFDIQSLDEIDMKYKVKCDEAGVKFEPPTLNETKQDRCRRFDRIRKNIVDQKYKMQCNEAGVLFDPPQSSESKQDRDRRLDRMKKRIKVARTTSNPQHAKKLSSEDDIYSQVHLVVSTLVNDVAAKLCFDAEEAAFKNKCFLSGVQYVPPLQREETNQTIARRIMLRDKCKENVPSTTLNLPSDNGCSNLINLNATSGSASSFTNISSNESASQQVRSAELEILHSNPKVLEAISEFETGETRHKICKCIVCDERRPVFNVIKNKVQAGKPRLTEFKNWSVDRKSVCERCKKDRKSKTLSAPRFSGCNSDNVDILPGALGHNNMHFEKVPDFLEGLTLVEVALISKITTIMKISMRKYGMLSSKGHSVSIPQNMKIARSLPLLPEEVGLVVLQRKNDKSKIKAYSVQRHKVENALKGLCYGFPHGGNLHESDETPLKYTGPDHIDRILNNRYFKFLPNRFYCDVNIIQTRLNELPIIRASYPGLTVLPVKSSNDNDSDNAEQPQIDDDTQSGIMILDPQNSEQHLLNFLTKLLGGDKEAALKAINEGEVGAVNWDKVQGEPLHELKTPGFFCMSYPNIFINGSCDITIPGLSSIKFDDWVQHIYYATDNRVAQHPFLKFHLLNLNMRHKALNQGSFLVAQQLDDAHLSLSELKDNFEAGDYSVPRKIISVGKNLTNTAPYWADVKRNLDALTFHRRLKNKNMPAYFTTGSCAEHHFVALHLLLADYHATINNLPLQDVIDQMESDPAFKHKIITKNLHIITNYFQARTHNFFVTVGKELYLWDDLWFRFEFAKQRGEIHFHGLMWSDKHSSIIEEALRPLLSDRAATSEAALNLKEFLQIQGCYQGQDIYSPEFQSMHPGGGNEVITSSGNMDWIPNKSKWAPPEGTYTNNSNPLSISINDCVHEEGAMMSHLVDLVNRLSLHQCTTSYCLKTKSKNSEVKFCRFHFGEYDPVTKQCSGKDLHPFHPEITAGDHPRYDGNRDHPRMIQHVPAHLFAWKANCDIQPVVDTDLHALLNYLGEYACKANVTSAELMRMYQVIMGASNDSASVRSIAQKLLLKTCGCIDVSASAADYINTSGPMHRSSRTFTRVGLSGYRILRDCEVQGTVTSKNKVDKFLQEERRLRKPEQTLYDFCTECDCNCKTEHIPVFTGLPIIPKWPPTSEYCKAMLMIFSRGTWYKESDLMGPYDNFPQAFADFIETEDCPETVKELLEAAKAAHDRKRNKVVNRQAPSTSAPESQSQSQNSQSSSQCENEFGLSRALMRDFAMSHAQELDNPTTEQELNHGPPNYDWHAEGLATFNTFVQDLSILDSAETWLAKTEQDIQKVLNDHNDRLNLPERDPLACNELQRIALGINMEQMLNVYLDPDNTPQCILVVQGAGGTGKSFIIETATRIARRLFGRNGAVLNLAPTGAAAVLLPDGRTIHSVINIPTMQRRKKKAGKDTTTHQVSDFPMSRDQIKKLQTITGIKGDNIKLKLLNMDERS